MDQLWGNASRAPVGLTAQVPVALFMNDQERQQEANPEATKDWAINPEITAHGTIRKVNDLTTPFVDLKFLA